MNIQLYIKKNIHQWIQKWPNSNFELSDGGIGDWALSKSKPTPDFLTKSEEFLLKTTFMNVFKLATLKHCKMANYQMQKNMKGHKYDSDMTANFHIPEI